MPLDFIDGVVYSAGLGVFSCIYFSILTVAWELERLEWQVSVFLMYKSGLLGESKGYFCEYIAIAAYD